MLYVEHKDNLSERFVDKTFFETSFFFGTGIDLIVIFVFCSNDWYGHCAHWQNNNLLTVATISSFKSELTSCIYIQLVSRRSKRQPWHSSLRVLLLLGPLWWKRGTTRALSYGSWLFLFELLGGGVRGSSRTPLGFAVYSPYWSSLLLLCKSLTVQLDCGPALGIGVRDHVFVVVRLALRQYSGSFWSTGNRIINLLPDLLLS